MDELKRKRVSELLQSYGADPKRWAAADRRVWSEAEADAKDLDDARSTDRILSHSPSIDVPRDFEHRLMRRISLEPKRVAAPKASAWNPLRWFVALPLAASLMLGFYLGAEGKL